MPSVPRLPLAAGLLCATIAAAGLGWEARRFGSDLASSRSRLEAEVRGRISEQAGSIRQLARQVAADATSLVTTGSASMADHRPALFTRLSRISSLGGSPVSATIYAPRPGLPAGYDVLAWSDGPAEDVARDRLAGPEALFVAPGTAGHRLVFVLPIDRGARRVAVVASETTLSRTTSNGKVIDTLFGPVTVMAQYEGAGVGAGPANGFVIADDAGGPFLEVRFSIDALTLRRRVFRERVLATAAAPLIAAALWVMLRGLDARRRRAVKLRGWLIWSVLLVAVAGGGAAGVARLATAVGASRDVVAAIVAAGAAGAAAILAGLLWRREHRQAPAAAPLRFAAEHFLGGVVLAIVIASLTAYLRTRITAAALDRWQITLFPFEPGGLLYPGSLILIELALCWIAVTALMLVRLRWRARRSTRSTFAGLALWLAPTLAVLAASDALQVPVAPALVLAAAAAAVAHFGPWLRWRYRRTTQAARLLLGFAALVVPAIVVYPMAASIAGVTARQVIEREYAPAAAGHQEALRRQLARAQREIDRLPELGQSAIEPRVMDTQAAFDIWRQTSLSESRVAADVELYDVNRTMVSRFALNLPQYLQAAPEKWEGASCNWEVYGEVTRFGAVNRLLLRAERALCGPNETLLGAIVVHVAQDDYAALPFVPTSNAYVGLLGGQPAAAPAAPRDLQVVVYGWSLQPLFTSGRVAWPITNELFTRVYQTGTPFWAVLREDDRAYDVHFTQNRSGIYALGYPSATLFEHIARLAEMVALAGLVFLLVELGAGLVAAAAGRRNAPVRVLLREIRRSFYRKLFLFFVLAAIGPVVVLALLFGGYLTAQLRAEAEAEASGVVTVARRVFEELEAAVQHPDQPPPPPSHDLMLWIRQVIHQDVNFFDGATLVASSQRELFDSGLLPTRTPAAVYRAVVIDRLPTAVVEHPLGGVPHVVAATTVISHGRDAILSVPLAPRQREIEREIQDLNRSVLVGAVLVVLFAAALGAWAARRVSDPVARLSKATREIAQGRLDITIAADTADELRRLIDDFNRMTVTLRSQRAALARTNQLKAWNEMARQVAHEIKNPLTPIQLAAEHLQRVHADQGAPLGAPFDTCVRTILDQVRLLRQIASEFANFSGDLVARPESVALPAAVEGVVAPYRLGLDGRVRFELALPADLPDVRADRTLLARALTNLVENAIQAMPAGGTLRVTAVARAGTVVLSIVDTGVGMSPDAAERAFQPYFSTKTGGSGLGLPNARRNIELGGGAVTLTSAPGAGTTVTITLPVADRSAAGDSAPGPPR